MKQTILDIKPYYNERWPRKGYLYVPTFMLFEGDRLHFNWKPVVLSRTLKFEIEKTDYKADYSENIENVIKIELENTYTFVVQETGLYNIPIENPKYEEGEIGQLLIVREFNENINQQTSPYPERFYNYSIENSNSIKKCSDWGYLTDRGACIVEKCVDKIESFDIFFDSSKKDFHLLLKSKDRIDKTIFFRVKKGDEIFVELNKKQIEGFVINVNFEKKDRVGFWGQIDTLSKFTSNEDSIFQLTASIYSSTYGFEGNVPIDFCEIKLYGNKVSKLLDFDKEYELIKVYNTVFNREEFEPMKMPVANTRYKILGIRWLFKFVSRIKFH